MKNLLSSLLPNSPFDSLQKHAQSVSDCVFALKEFFKEIKNRSVKAQETGQRVSELEHQADKIKDNIRDNLSKAIFLPVDRENLLEILSIQDAIADTAEDIAVLTLIKEDLIIPDDLLILLDIMLDKSIETFSVYKNIIDELDELLEATFTGPQAEKIRKKIDEVAYKEHETDGAQKVFLKKFFSLDKQLSQSDFFIIAKLSRRIGDIANISEKAANKIRLILLK